MSGYPKVKSVEVATGRRLLVTFGNGVRKIYDCTPLLEDPEFQALREEWFFRMVRADLGGYGASWSDDLDLSESELWENGVTQQDPLPDAEARSGTCCA